MGTNTILLASVEPSVLKRWREAFDDSVTLRAVESARELRQVLDAGDPEMLLLDIALPELGGIKGVTALLAEKLNLLVLCCAGQPSEDEGLELIRAGARGYCNAYMAPSLLRKAVELVCQGEVWVGRKLILRLISEMNARNGAGTRTLLAGLTSREREIARMVGDGASNKQIARDLDITERTVKAHMSSIFQKTSAKDRLQLALLITGQMTFSKDEAS